MMFYLVTTDGRRSVQTALDLAGLSQQPRKAVDMILEYLLEAGILRLAYGSKGGADQTRYEVAHDALASALLEWHSQYVLGQTRAATDRSFPTRGDAGSTGASPPESRPARDFPYRLVRDAMRQGRIVPFLGAGVPLSARPQDSSSMWQK